MLVGGGAQVLYTDIERLTDIDMVGWVTPTDNEALASAGFTREGRHWVYGGTTPRILVEVPDTTLFGHDEPLLFQTPSGVTVQVISLRPHAAPSYTSHRSDSRYLVGSPISRYSSEAPYQLDGATS